MTLFLAVVVCKVVIVSRLHGSDFPSCGKGNNLKTACRTIAFATTQAQWNDTIRIDGTDTSRDPYPCSSMLSNQNGIFADKSLSFKKFGNAEVILKCSESKLCLMAEMHRERLVFGSWGFHSLTVGSLCRNVHCLSKVAYSEMLFLFQTRRPSLTFSLLKDNLSWR